MSTVPSTTPLTTLASLKLFLQANPNLSTPFGPINDATLQLYINEVSPLISEWCGREFALTSYTEYYSGYETMNLILNQRPVTVLTNIWSDCNGNWGNGTNAFTADPLVNGVDYSLVPDQPDGSSRSGIVRALKCAWRGRWVWVGGLLTPQLKGGNGNIKVSYTAGYDPIPQDIQLACNLAIALLRTLAPWGRPLTAESYEERHVSFFNVMNKYGLLSYVVSMLARYRDVSWGGIQ